MITSEVRAPARAGAKEDRRARRSLGPGEWALLILFALFSVWVLGLDLYQVIAHGRVWTGSDGPYPTDQLQYMAWVSSASQHLLVANMFVIHSTPADYFQPAVLISGLLVAAGVAPWLALLLWQPIGVVGMFLAVRAYVRSALPGAGPGPWLAAIALTLFYGSFTTVYGSFGVLGDLFPGFWAWGYAFGLMAIAAIIGALVIYASARREGRISWWPGVLGALASLLHPWQGELMVMILVLVELFSPETRAALGRIRSVRQLRIELSTPRVRLAVLTTLATLLPLLYYEALNKFDTSWNLGSHSLKHDLSAISIFLVVLPLGLVALTGYRGKASNFLIRVARVWPVATIVIYLGSGASGNGAPLHTFLGITLALSVLAVDGCRRLGWGRLRFGRAAAVALILLFTVPTTYYEMKEAADNVTPTRATTNFITSSEHQALSFLRRDPMPGGVLARLYLGRAIPGLTRRNTYVGVCVWSQPNCPGRTALANRLVRARMTPAESQRFVLSTHARFVVTDCQVHVKNHLIERLGPVLQSVHRFGCATVYQVE